LLVPGPSIVITRCLCAVRSVLGLNRHPWHQCVIGIENGNATTAIAPRSPAHLHDARLYRDLRRVVGRARQAQTAWASLVRFRSTSRAREGGHTEPLSLLTITWLTVFISCLSRITGLYDDLRHSWAIARSSQPWFADPTSRGGGLSEAIARGR
jgi:hypothetical protein